MEEVNAQLPCYYHGSIDCSQEIDDSMRLRFVENITDRSDSSSSSSSSSQLEMRMPSLPWGTKASSSNGIKSSECRLSLGTLSPRWRGVPVTNADVSANMSYGPSMEVTGMHVIQDQLSWHDFPREGQGLEVPLPTRYSYTGGRGYMYIPGTPCPRCSSYDSVPCSAHRCLPARLLSCAGVNSGNRIQP